MRKKLLQFVLAIALLVGGVLVAKPAAHASTPFWKQSSEKKAYPSVSKHPNMWILVSKKKQRTYLVDNGKILYTMLCSTGTTGDNATPTGTYHIQAEKGTFFYNQSSGEGAKYWVSWKDHGTYLFHTVPTDENGNYITSEAKKLGKKASSHGCVRLSVADAKWLYNNVTTGTKVVITNSGNIKKVIKANS